jgi:hypothetical protein
MNNKKIKIKKQRKPRSPMNAFSLILIVSMGLCAFTDCVRRHVCYRYSQIPLYVVTVFDLKVDTAVIVVEL